MILAEEAIWHLRRVLSYEINVDNSLIVLSHRGPSNFGPSLPGNYYTVPCQSLSGTYALALKTLQMLLFDIQEKIFRMKMTEIIRWLSCGIVAPPTLAHPFLLIITQFLIQEKKDGVFFESILRQFIYSSSLTYIKWPKYFNSFWRVGWPTQHRAIQHLECYNVVLTSTCSS